MLYARVDKRKVLEFPLSEKQVRARLNALGIGVPVSFEGLDLTEHGFVEVEQSHPEEAPHITQCWVLDPPVWKGKKLTRKFRVAPRPLPQLYAAIDTALADKLAEPFTIFFEGAEHQLHMRPGMQAMWISTLAVATALVQKDPATPLPLRISYDVLLNLTAEQHRNVLTEALLRNINIREEVALLRGALKAAHDEGKVHELNIDPSWFKSLQKNATLSI